MRKLKKTQVLLIAAAIAFGLSATIPLTANALETETASDATTLGVALNSVDDGGTITLTSDIDYTDSILQGKDKSFTLNLDGNTLTITSTVSPNPYYAEGCISVGEGHTVSVTGGGTVNIDIINIVPNGTGAAIFASGGEFEADSSVYIDIKTSGRRSAGIYAYDSGSITMHGNIAATGESCDGAFASRGGEIILYGDVSAFYDADSDGSVHGAYAYGDNSSVTINGNATATNTGAHVNGNGRVTINGDAVATGTEPGNWGAIAFVGTIIINGDAKAGVGSRGSHADGGGTVIVNGDVISGDSSLSFQSYSPAAVGGDGSIGVYAAGGSRVTIDGELVSSDIYIRFYTPVYEAIDKQKSDYEPVSTKTGYREYTDGNSIVWVLDDGSTPITTPTPEPTEHEFDDVPKTGDDTINSSEAVMQIIALISLGIGGVAAGFIVYRKKQAAK